MDFEFDKEIDAILRRARRGGEVVTSAGSHPDADEISAFAENAVSDAARQRYTAHFADCARCRKILSNVIVFNSEAETETASSAVLVETTAEKTPWYRKLFAFPQLAYAMGAMVLLFSGFFGYLILQNLPGAGGSDVSYSTNRAVPASQSAPSNSTVSSTANSNSANAATTNSTLHTNTSATSNSATLPASNKTVSATPSEKTSDLSEATPAITDVQPMATPAAKPDAKVADNASGDDDKKLAKVAPATPMDQPSAAGAARQERDREDSSLKDAQKNEALSEQQLKTKRSAPQNPKKQISKPGETRSVGGKTFNNVGGIWFDSALGKQKQKTVDRSTSEYLRLDAGLRSIADSLGGTVVILWNGKAYRIQ